jgi:undecaprenyl-diphosphatase
MDLEFWLLDHIQQWLQSDFMDRFWTFVTHLGDLGLVWIVISLVLFFYKPTRRIGFMCIVSLLLGTLFTNGLLKNIIQRPRPFTYNDYKLLIDTPKEFSFPSGHTTASFAVTFVLIRMRAMIGSIKIYPWVTILALMVAFSRLYLYVHFVSDIAAGIAIGYLCSLLAEKAVKYLESKRGIA